MCHRSSQTGRELAGQRCSGSAIRAAVSAAVPENRLRRPKPVAIAPLPSGVGQHPGPWVALVPGASTAARSAPLNSPEYGEEERMTTVAAEPAAPAADKERHRLTAEPGSWWLVLLGGLAGQAAQVAEADRGRAALLATVSHDLRAPLAAAKAAVSGLRADHARLTADDRADLLAAAEESLDRLAHLAASLLDVGRLQ